MRFGCRASPAICAAPRAALLAWCPSDLPSGDTAKPQCALKTTTGGSYCALICTPSAVMFNGANGECGTGTCQSIAGIGLCTYAASEESFAKNAVLQLEDKVGTNP